jgi:tetratricopeptide (TPR) repeat protein
MAGWRSALVIGALALCAHGCSRTVAPRTSPPAPARARAAAAAALVRAGCLDCLIEAYDAYRALLTDPSIASDAVTAAAQTAALIAVRERELGIADSGRLDEARALASASPALSAAIAPLFEIIETLGARGAPGTGPVANDSQLALIAKATRSRMAWMDLLRARADESGLTAYVTVAFSCSYDSPRDEAIETLLGALPSWRDTPLIRFRLASCTALRAPALQQLLADDARFLEVTYFSGLEALALGNLDAAEAELGRAYTWRPEWAALTNLRAGVFMAAEDFDRAAEFYGRTLAIVPDQPDALLGRVRALTFAGRYQEALGAIDALLALERWYVGDAHYWRALNHEQLGQHDEAWGDIEQAAKLITNGDVPKLAGIIAVQRRQLPIARAKFEEAFGRAPSDCETSYFLGVVASDLRDWTAGADALTNAADCFERSLAELEAEIARLRAAALPPDRQARQIARREQQLDTQRRMQATAWFNAAVASFNLSRYADARKFAERLTDDLQFGDRAREVLSRLPPQ